MKMKVFEYVLLWHPNEKEEKEGKKSKLIEHNQILALDDKSASLQVARKIPEEYNEELDKVEILMRPF